MRKNRLITTIAIFFILLACKDDPAPAPTFSIRGSITENGLGIEGVTILVDGQRADTTSGTGTFAIDSLAPATYIIKPEQAGRTFTPATLSVTLTDANSEENDFTRVTSFEWTKFNPDVYSIKVNTATTLQLDLEQNALWYQASRGGLYYQTVTGDFTITATVNAVKKSDNTQPVACNICLGGLMVRNPSEVSGENYVHLVSGFTPNGPGFEVKSTTNNVSAFQAFGDGSTKHDLRIVRFGDTFTLYRKLSTSAEWVFAISYTRSDLPLTLMVGVNIYTSQAGPVADLSVIYENITIE